MNNDRLFIDIHAIHSVPPSNVNRDDTGSPKTALYGGSRRARVSSQAWKKAMRDYFRENGGQSNVGVRTLEIVKYVAEKIRKLSSSVSYEEAFKKAESVINNANISTKDGRAKALFFLADKQAEELARAALSGQADKNELQRILQDNVAADIALFGRMVADDAALNEDASCQVAHSISTHAVNTEFDFYTAVDDLAPEDNAGAGMLGTIEYNSSTLYRYCNVAIHELSKQLKDDQLTRNTIALFIKAFANSMPTGKINTFANQTLPSLIVVVARKDRPVNLVSAFEEAVKGRDGYIKESEEKLLKELGKVKKYVEEPLFTLCLSMDEITTDASLKCVESLNALASECVQRIML